MLNVGTPKQIKEILTGINVERNAILKATSNHEQGA